MTKWYPVPPTGRRFRWLGWTTLAGCTLLAVAMLHLVTNNADSSDKPKRDEFAADRPGGEKAVEIDARRVMDYLEAVCKIGPRISGSEGMAKQQKMIEKHVTDLGAKVRYQKFSKKQRTAAKPVEMANLIVSYHPDRARRVILCSHYDTRPIADQEHNVRRWNDPFVSANDGGSGVALLMELGNHMKDLETKVGVDFVFFDGEEYIFDPKKDEYFFGSKHFAAEYRKARRTTEYKGAILLDMIAGKGATFPVEQNSWVKAGKLTKEVWGIAAELKCDSFQEKLSRFAVEDDHIPLNAAGIPAIDIIDFDYPHWHRLTDLPKNCSAATMAQVGKVCSVWLQRVQ
jgi:glutaminyl-peptide cyclotransferase